MTPRYERTDCADRQGRRTRELVAAYGRVARAVHPRGQSEATAASCAGKANINLSPARLLRARGAK